MAGQGETDQHTIQCVADMTVDKARRLVEARYAPIIEALTSANAKLLEEPKLHPRR